MNIAIIKAGGVGNRMGAGIPKQFIEVFDKPLIIYTLEAFEKHPDIDSIIVVCVNGWHDILKAYAKKYNISKLVEVVNGGETSLKSILCGLKAAVEKYTLEDTVIIHDGNRPLVSQEIISDVLAKCQIEGAAVAAIPCDDEVMVVNTSSLAFEKYLDHKTLYRIQTPDAYKLKDIVDLFAEATEEDLTKFGATNVLAIEKKRKIKFVLGSSINIRLTTTEDISLFKSLFQIKNNK